MVRKEEKMHYQIAIFDMDGTILDTLEDLTDSVNFALFQAGFPRRTKEEVCRFVGNGIQKLIERAVPKETSITMINQVYSDFKEYYKEHCADKTKPYEGIVPLLMKLKKAGCKTAVVSNKADFAVQELCKAYFDGMIDLAVGERAGIKKKPAPDSVLEILKKSGICRENAIYIGDSDVDIETACHAQIDSILVDWGFRKKEFLIEKGAKRIVSDPEEIAKIIL